MSAVKTRAAALGVGLALLTACVTSSEPAPGTPAMPEPQPEAAVESLFGNYLAGRFAGSRRDTRAAADFFVRALAQDSDNPSLVRRTFLLMVADGRVEEALPLAATVLERSPGTAVASLVLALGDFKRGDYEAALARLESTPRENSNALLVPLIAAWTHAARNQAEAAMGALDPLLEREAFKPFHNFHSALIQDFAGEAQAAEAAYRAALESTSGNTLGVVEAYGAFLERDARGQEARRHYLDYLARHPKNAVISAALARLERGEVAAAATVDPAHGAAEALLDVSSVLASDRTRVMAQMYVRLALYLRPEMMPAWMLLGELFENERLWQDALETYRQISPTSPYGWNARLRAASSLDRIDRSDEAVAMLRGLADLEPDRDGALITLADILRGRERYHEAVVAYDRAFGRIRGLEERHWPLLYARGIALERSQQWPRAEADFLRALELKPDQPLVLNYLGYSWVEQEVNIERALEMIEKAVELRPNDGYIVDSLGWVHYKLGNYEEAVAHLERAAELRPQDPTINDHLGDAYWRVGRVLEARFQWRRALSFEPDEELIPAIEAKLKAGLASSAPLGGGG